MYLDRNLLIFRRPQVKHQVIHWRRQFLVFLYSNPTPILQTVSSFCLHINRRHFLSKRLVALELLYKSTNMLKTQIAKSIFNFNLLHFISYQLSHHPLQIEFVSFYFLQFQADRQFQTADWLCDDG